MSNYGKHGFIGSDIPSDATVLAISQEFIDDYRLKLNMYEYTQWKLDAASITLQERQLQKKKHNINVYDPHLDSRIKYTMSVINACNSILSERVDK